MAQPTNLSTLTGAHDAKLEEALIGSVMIYPEILEESWAQMSGEIFYLERHRRAWQVLQDMHRNWGHFDFVAFCHELEQRYGPVTAVEVSGIILTDQFWSAYSPSSLYAHQYAHGLKKLFVKRERAKATLAYHTKIAESGDDTDARLELEAVLLVLDQMLKPDEVISDEDLALLIGESAKFPTGYVDVDKQLRGLAMPGLNVLVAASSVGKSAFARGIIRNAVKRGESVFYYSQDQAANQIYELEISRLLQMDSTRVPYLPNDRLAQAIARVRNEIWQNRVKLVDSPLVLSQLVSAAKNSNCTFMVVDYLQIIDAGMNERFLNITETSMALKSLALQLRIPVLALAQFNRRFEEGEEPQMNWIDGSSQIEKDADIILAILRDKRNPYANGNVYGMKNKTGKLVNTWVQWVGKYASYENAEHKYKDEDAN